MKEQILPQATICLLYTSPKLPGTNTFHSTELFHIYEATPGYTPLLIVASYDYFNKDKAQDYKQNNYVAGVQWWFYPKCRLQAQYTLSLIHI